MGGSVGMTIRLSDEIRKPDEQEIYKMDRWTNSFPQFINHHKLVESDRNHFDDYMESWWKMKDDWEKNGPDGPFEHLMTDGYFPGNIMAPSEYGLIVVDYKTKTILTMQMYSHVGGVTLFQADEDDKKNIGWFLSNGKVTISDFKGNVTTPINTTVDQLLIRKPNEFTEILLDLSPWGIVDLGEKTLGGGLQMARLIEQLGIPFTDKDIRGWKEFVMFEYECLLDDYDEDDEDDEILTKHGFKTEWDEWFKNKTA